MTHLQSVIPGHVEISEDVDAEWTAVYSATVQNGVPVVYEVRVYPRAFNDGARMALTSDGRLIPIDADELPKGGLTSRAIRQVKPPRALKSMLEDARSRIMLSLAGEEWSAVRVRAEAALSAARLTRRQRLALVAWMYEAAVSEGIANVNASIAATFTEVGVPRSASQIRDDVYASRIGGLLSEGRGYGHASGQLTDKGRRILEELQQ